MTIEFFVLNLILSDLSTLFTFIEYDWKKFCLTSEMNKQILLLLF